VIKEERHYEGYVAVDVWLYTKRDGSREKWRRRRKRESGGVFIHHCIDVNNVVRNKKSKSRRCRCAPSSDMKIVVCDVSG